MAIETKLPSKIKSVATDLLDKNITPQVSAKAQGKAANKAAPGALKNKLALNEVAQDAVTSDVKPEVVIESDAEIKTDAEVKPDDASASPANAEASADASAQAAAEQASAGGSNASNAIHALSTSPMTGWVLGGAVLVGAVAAGGGGGGGGSGGTAPVNPAVDGSLFDGYIRGAEIYIDKNGNGILDDADMVDGPIAVTDEDGQFTIPADTPLATIFAVGGVNIDTGVPNTLTLTSPAGSVVVSPLTTLVQAYMLLNPTVKLADASAAVASAFGLTLPEGVNLTTYDSLAALSEDSGDALALAFQKAAVQVATVVTLADNFDDIVALIGTNGSLSALVDGEELDALLNVLFPDGVPEDIEDVIVNIVAATDLSAITLAQSLALDIIAPDVFNLVELVEENATSDLTDGLMSASEAVTTTFRVSFEKLSTDGKAVVVGDTLELLLGGDPFNTPIIVTLGSDDIIAGYVDFTVLKADLGADGNKSLTAVITDLAGNGDTSAAITFTLDTVAPDAPLTLIEQASTDLADDLMSGSEAVTTMFRVSFNDSAVADDTVELLLGGEPFSTPIIVTLDSDDIIAGYVDFTVLKADLGADGNKSLTAVITDLAGNESVASTPITFTLDTTAITPDASLTTDSGESNSDGITNDASITAPTNKETDALVEYRIRLADDSFADDAADWSDTYSEPTVDGSYVVEVRQTDVAGNVSASQSITFTLDTTAITPDASLTTDSGDSNSDGITNDASITAPLNEEEGALVEYRIRLADDSFADDDADWSDTYSEPTVDGSYVVEVRQTDVAGNVSASQSITFTLDASEPTLGATSPTDGNTAVQARSDITLTFNEDVVLADSGTIKLYKGDGTLVQTFTFDAGAAAGVSVNGSVVTIDPSSNLDKNTSYYILIDSGAILDLAGNSYSGISDPTLLNFVTANNASPTISLGPEFNATGVAITADDADAGDTIALYIGSTKLGDNLDNDTAETVQFAAQTTAVLSGELTVQDSGGGSIGTGFDVYLGTDTVGGGGDTLAASVNAAAMYGFGGADSITGGSGIDSLFGGNGNDTLAGNASDAVFDGGADVDTLKVANGFDDASNDQIVNIETVELTAAGSLNLGNQSEDLTIKGFATGANTIIGGSGKDTIYGGTGNDSLTGGSGDDTFYVDAGTDAITDLSGSDVMKVAVTATLNATVTAAFVADTGTKNLGTANLTTNGFSVNLSGADSLTGGFTVTNNGAGATLIGSAGNDTLIGGANSDRLEGGAGNDSLIGSGADDTLIGGLGNDTIFGGLGNDTIQLSLGSVGDSDTVIIRSTLDRNGADTIVNFKAGAGSGSDVIKFDTIVGGIELGGTAFSAGISTFKQNSNGSVDIKGHLVIYDAGNNSIADVDSALKIAAILNTASNNDIRISASSSGVILAGSSNSTTVYVWSVVNDGTTQVAESEVKLLATITLDEGQNINNFDASNFLFSQDPFITVNNVTSDNLVNSSEADAGIVVSGTVVNGGSQQVTVTITGDVVKTYHNISLNVDGTWSVNVTKADLDALGQRSLSVQANITNNSVTANGTHEFVYDSTAPTAPTSVALTAVGGTVVANTVNSTNTHLTATATITAGQATDGKAELYIGSTLVATDSTILAGDNSVTFTTSDDSPLSAELQALITAGAVATVKLYDAAGNVVTSSVSNPMLTVDYIAPTAPTSVALTAVGGTVVANTVNSTNTNLTATATITAGQATGGKAELYIGSTLVATDSTILIGDTIVNFNTSGGTPELQALITAGAVATVKLYDAAGNVVTSSVSNPTLTVDYIAPTAPTSVALTAVGGTVVANTVNSTNTNLTATATITAGQATGGKAELYIGSTLVATDSTILIGDTIVNFNTSGGTPELQALITAGAVATVKLYDAAGNVVTSSVSNPTLTVDYIAPTANFASATDDAGSVTGTLVSGARTDDTTLALAGSCEAGSVVRVYNGGTLLGTAVVSGTTWSYSATIANVTTYQFNVIETDAAGNVSAASSNFTVTGDTVAPVVSITSFTEKTSTGSEGVTLAGVTDEKGGAVKIYNTTTLLGTSAASDIATGAWAYDLIGAGTYQVTAESSDIAGNKGTSSSYNLIVGTTTGDASITAAASSIIFGLAGDDVITGSSSADTIYGGAGDDRFIYTSSANLLSSTALVDSILGGDGTDSLALDASTAAFTIASTLSFATRISGVEKIISAGASANAISVTLNNDAYEAGIRAVDLSADTNATGTNVINVSAESGTTNTYVLVGSSGVDSITGGAGNDTMTGGGGSDVFKLISGALGLDTITDFDFGTSIAFTDRIDLSGRGLKWDGNSTAIDSLVLQSSNTAFASSEDVLVLNSNTYADLAAIDTFYEARSTVNSATNNDVIIVWQDTSNNVHISQGVGSTGAANNADGGDEYTFTDLVVLQNTLLIGTNNIASNINLTDFIT